MFTIIMNIWDFIVIGIILFVVIICFINSLIQFIIITYKEHSKRYHNCFECKFWKLNDVSSAGGKCYYICERKPSIEEGFDFNEHIKYEKCKECILRGDEK